MKCNLCGRGVFEIGGYLERVNQKGVPGVFECRPNCDAQQSQEENLLQAIDGGKGEPDLPSNQ